ncbi:MAG: MFS transporter [Vulcanimicrobiota bacterium]
MLRQTFLSLRSRNYRLFFIGQSISNTGNWLTRVALVLLVLKLTGSGLHLGLVTACEFGPVLVLSAWAGAIADRVDKRYLLILTQALEMLQSFGLAALAFMPRPPLAALYALTLVGGALLAFDNPLRRSFVTEMVPKEDIPNAVVLYSLIVNLSRAFGPALAGLLVTTVGFGWSFVIDATSYVAVLVCLGMMRPEELHRGPTSDKTEGSVLEGLRYLGAHPRLWVNFAMLLAIGVMAYNFSVSLPLFVTDSLHTADTVFTLLYTVFSLGAVVGALVVAYRNLVGMNQILWGATAFGVSMLILAATPSVASAAAAAFVVGLAHIVYITSTTALVQVESEPAMHGRVLSIQTVIIGASKVIGGPLIGWIGDLTGGRLPIVLGGLACLFSAAFGHLTLRRRS